MVDSSKQVPFAPGLWHVEPSGEPRLSGSRCVDCTEVYFPVKSSSYCPHCYGSNLEDAAFGPTGTLAAFTTVHQPPAGGYYHGPMPFSYGLVDLDEGVRVETHLGGDVHAYRIGARMTLAIESFYVNEEGEDVQVFRFVPAEGAQEGSK